MAGGWSTTKVAILGVTVFALSLTIGVLAGYFGRRVPETANSSPDGVVLTGVTAKIISDADPRISKLLLNEISAENIRQNLKDYASHPHLAGTPADLQQAEHLKQTWLEQGLDRVDILGYDVLLSYPKDGDPNIISLVKAGTTVFESQREEKELRPEDIHPEDKIVPPFNAYSPAGDVESNRLIYANYGREEDFHWLSVNKSVNFTDAIVLARYGKIFRSNKVKLAAELGAKAVILYSDPHDYTSPTDNSSYPNSWWLPSTGVQRGTVKRVDGDPTTYLYPSLDSAYREDASPIYLRFQLIQSAMEMLNSFYTYLAKSKMVLVKDLYSPSFACYIRLGGEEVPESWRGSIPGVTYRFGGEFPESDLKVKVHITTHNVRRKTYNVIGYIDGAVEPDRYVVVGNHRDGWVYGSVDPSSATAVMIEASRALTSVMKSSNWRPRRTIVFCSWGAEEHGLVGSTEFTEHFSKILGQKAVAYLNADIALEGTDFMRFKASPMFYPAVMAAAKKIPNPNPAEVAAGRTTAFDTWLYHIPSDDPTKPRVFAVGSGSDYSSFLNVLGIPCLEPRYTWNYDKWKISSYPMYHSVYETFFLMDNITDPGFKYSKAVTQVWAELVRDVSDAMILPLDAKSLSDYISVESKKIFSKYGDSMRANNLTSDIEYFNEAVTQLQKDVDDFVASTSQINKDNPYAVREVNDKLMNLHRNFLDPQGLPGRPIYKNILSSPSQFNSYAGAVFPGITDSLHRIEINTDPDKWKKVQKNMSIATYLIGSAASSLRKSTHFTRTE
ncbi:hypothetical protein EB796_022317 [Bugula neritina]|uniref:Aminopeptidase NAALADL1 n=1 Tax=Bugula neritina TaxID=10212 RepID=A0A7J7IZN7_BUGNE|nr:hypothetical protein EB796_022317 [Bugula neritina]